MTADRASGSVRSDSSYHDLVAFDEELANRIREIIGADRAVTEKRMFGGLAFLVNGHMSITVSGRGGALVRCDPRECRRRIAAGSAEAAVMRGRPMDGWMRVGDENLRTRRQLEALVHRSTAFARTLT